MLLLVTYDHDKIDFAFAATVRITAPFSPKTHPKFAPCFTHYFTGSMAFLLDIIGGHSGSLILALTCLVLVFQALILSITLFKTHSAHVERRELYHELFILMRKIENLSESKRGMVLHQFDNLLDSLIKQLPTRIAAEAGERIFETESQLLRALAEIEPAIGADQRSQLRLEHLVQSMENLEATVVSLTCESVRQAMLDVRESLFAQESANAAP